MARFFEAAAAGVRVAPILCANQSAVSLGWFWAMARSYLNDQVRGDLVLVLRLERFGYEALALVPRDLDLETNRYRSCERYLC